MSLIEIQKELFLKKINSVVPDKWKTLVVDRRTAAIINHLFSIHSLLEKKITAIEILENVRTPNSSFDVLYILEARDELIDCILKDDMHPKKYPGIYVSFVNEAERRFFDKLQNSSVADRLKCVDILHLNFMAVEKQVFEVRDRFSSMRLYHPSCSTLVRQELSDTAKDILSVCLSLRILPTIRCYYPKDARHDSKTMSFLLARMLQDHIVEYLREHPDYLYSSTKTVCFIADRSLDTFSPFLHEFTYQAMVHDLLKSKNGKYEFTIEGPNGKETCEGSLSDDDPIYCSIRHLHMRDAIEKLMVDFNKFCQEHTLFIDKSHATSLNDMRTMLADLSEFQETRDAFSLHLSLAQDCMSMFDKKKLAAVASIEQDLATGRDTEGKTPRSVLQAMVPLLDEPFMSAEDKTRLLALYIMFRDGVISQDFDRLIRHANIPGRYVTFLRNLEHLGARIIKSNLSEKSLKRKHTAVYTEANETTYELSRFIPRLKQVVQELLEDKLDEDLFPIIYTPETGNGRLGRNGPTTLRSSRPSWTRARTQVHTTQRDNCLVFIAGGLTYSEVRSCYELSDSFEKNVYIGSTMCRTPCEWMDFFSRITLPKEEVRLFDEQTKNIPCLQAPIAESPVSSPLGLEVSRKPLPASRPFDSLESSSKPKTKEEKKREKKKEKEREKKEKEKSKGKHKKLDFFSSSKDKSKSDGHKKKHFGVF
ncbi:SNARE binding protein Sec1 [Schizosaccharomyces japonicus yFS275]|uniref:SNARE binding protein Sec1 n=1 Tax=Schizosaccharomyces japonicus (strain yFS275 / FY16936) TaxID=402676 RepID=B6JYN1_SCHJY|nr:SNARE binding protein Sec1 [Schizosaccharomyces japonicus yFS275]EEB06649.1 SNARE binding protein Sec1 [Schizosaccharomyces japonicus yFS275]